MRPSRRPVANVLPALLVLAACAESSGPAPPSNPAASPDSIATGLLPAIVLEGEPTMPWAIEERMEHYHVPGVSVAVLEGGQIVWAQGWGVADRETGAPVTPETLFQAASISKPVSALAALSLVEDGVLSLDAPVNDYLTTWKVPDNAFTADSAVTLRGILTHSAGLTVWGFPGYRKDEPFSESQVLATNAQVLDGLGNTDSVRVYKVPGTSWQYSGGGYTVMEQMVEDVTGQPFDVVLRERVLEPAGMTHSTFAQPLPEARWPEAARGYRGTGDEVEGEWHTYPEQAAAGLWTTPSDLLTLSAHLLGILEGSVSDGVLSKAMLEAMLTPNHPGEEQFRAWGLGFGLDGTGDGATFGHGGANEGFRAQWTVYRNRDQGVAVMTNGDAGGALAGEIIRAVAAAYDWPGNRPELVRVRELDASALAAYAGTYHAEGADFVVTMTAGNGVLEGLAPGDETVVLHPDAETEDRFFSVESGMVIVFERNAAGRVTGFSTGGDRFVRR